MEEIVLTPCRFRGDAVVPVKGASATVFSWMEALAELVPPQEKQDQTAKINLRFARTGDYVGVRKKSVRGQDVLTSFVISNRGNGFGWLYKRYPEFPKTVEKIYRVENVRWQPEMVTEPTA